MKKRNLFWYVAYSAVLSLAFVGCSDDEENGILPPTPEESVTTGVYILNSGKMNSNNATLDYYNPETKELKQQVFSSVNGRGLGDTANDMIIYGSKVYIAVTNSNTIEITDLNAKSLKTISPKDEAGLPQSPRYFTSHGGKVYVTLFDGHVAAIDTTTMEITSQVKVGPTPDQLCVAGDKLYVANSGGYNPVPDSTLTVIDLKSFTAEANPLKVVINPRWVKSDSQGYLYVMSSGNYLDIPAALQRINPSTGETTVICTNDQITMDLVNDKLYIMSSESNKSTGWIAANTKYIIYDTETASIETENFITDGTTVSKPAYINVNPVDNSIYITAGDYTSTGDVYIYSSEGKFVNKLGVSGLNAMCSQFVFSE